MQTPNPDNPPTDAIDPPHQHITRLRSQAHGSDWFNREATETTQSDQDVLFARMFAQHQARKEKAK